jgi:hypothetical protein
VQLRSILFVVFTALSLNASAKNMIIAAKMGMWSFETENVRNRAESSSGFGAYSLEVGYSFSRHLLGLLGANLLMSDGISGSTGSGVDVGFRYYPLTDATQAETKTEDTYVRVNERWRPYAGLFLRQRDFNLALQSGYVGPGTSLGLDYNFNKNWHINAEFRYDMLYGSGEGTATQMNILIGLGIEL